MSVLFFDLEVTSEETGERVVTKHTSGPHEFKNPLEAARFVVDEQYSLPHLEAGYGSTTTHKVVAVREED